MLFVPPNNSYNIIISVKAKQVTENSEYVGEENKERASRQYEEILRTQ